MSEGDLYGGISMLVNDGVSVRTLEAEEESYFYTLSKLERVLKTINDSDFGLCRGCEEPIPFERLMIVPETNMCVECAEKLL